MTHEFHAIYENGVLRPVTPLNLPELTRVAGTLQEVNPPTTASADEVRRQQAALDAMFQAIDAMPQTPSTDELSGRDHDKILYGSGT